MSDLQKQYMAESGKRPTYSLGYTNSYIDWLENRITSEEKLQAEVERLKRLVKKAYHEGRFDKGCGCGEWKESDALEALAEQEASDEPTT